MSAIGALIGAPLGLMPILMSYYAAGEGTNAEQNTKKAYQNFLLNPELVAELYRRGFPSEDEKWKWFEDLRKAWLE